VNPDDMAELEELARKIFEAVEGDARPVYCCPWDALSARHEALTVAYGEEWDTLAYQDWPDEIGKLLAAWRAQRAGVPA
jgi:hypothetical protein